jgi:hypothetical protein
MILTTSCGVTLDTEAAFESRANTATSEGGEYDNCPHLDSCLHAFLDVA